MASLILYFDSCEYSRYDCNSFLLFIAGPCVRMVLTVEARGAETHLPILEPSSSLKHCGAQGDRTLPRSNLPSVIQETDKRPDCAVMLCYFSHPGWGHSVTKRSRQHLDLTFSM